MPAKRRILALGTTLALVLPLALPASADEWVNPDGSRVGASQSDEPRSREPNDEPDVMARHDWGGEPEYEPRVDVAPRPTYGSNNFLPRATDYPVPRGHMPPPGACRVWFLGRPPGHQPPPGPCEQLEWRVPHGAILVRGDRL